MTTALQGLTLICNRFTPKQLSVARKSTPMTDTLMVREIAQQIPVDVFMVDLKAAGEEKVADIATVVKLHRQVKVAQKVPDMYAILRELDLEWPRFVAMFPEAAKDGWLQLLVNRARVVRDEIDEIGHVGR
jgi:hypothetical protein